MSVNQFFTQLCFPRHSATLSLISPYVPPSTASDLMTDSGTRGKRCFRWAARDGAYSGERKRSEGLRMGRDWGDLDLGGRGGARRPRGRRKEKGWRAGVGGEGRELDCRKWAVAVKRKEWGMVRRTLRRSAIVVVGKMACRRILSITSQSQTSSRSRRGLLTEPGSSQASRQPPSVPP